MIFIAPASAGPIRCWGVIDSEQVESGARQIRAVHGCFDNCVDIVETTLRRILADGGAPAPPRADWNLDY